MGNKTQKERRPQSSPLWCEGINAIRCTSREVAATLEA